MIARKKINSVFSYLKSSKKSISTYILSPEEYMLNKRQAKIQKNIKEFKLNPIIPSKF